LPHNRRIAETFARCGLVERSDQGADRILEECVRHGKPLPDYSRSDPHEVWLTLDGEIRDDDFLKFLEPVGQEALDTLDPHDFLILGLIASGKRLPAGLQPHVPRLLELGILDRTGRGKPILAKRFYSPATGASAKAIERDAVRQRNRMALSDHISRHAGCSLHEITAAFPELTRNQIQSYLKQLRADKLIHPSGPTRSARWFPGPQPRDTGRGQA
jgi:ATP-dependent DNA helicase RecG